jgi:four helix bundle protein
MKNGGIGFQNLVVWKRSHQIVLRIYALTRLFPPEERFGLASQLRRAAVSIASNIAEGRSRAARGSYRALVDVALGSAGEVYYQLLLARDPGYIVEDECAPLMIELLEVTKMLGALRRTLALPGPDDA